MQYLASIDQSTTSTKCTLFDLHGKVQAQSIIEHQQHTPAQGWLEHDPNQIISNLQLTIEQAVSQLKQKNIDFSSKLVKGVGVTNQRETVVAWSPKTGKALHHAIVWCDTRCKDICDKFSSQHGDNFKHKTGLPVSTYFTLFKILWLKENVPAIAQAIKQGEIRFGTIDTWVIFNLTGKYVTDASNASRTFLCNLKGEWDQQLLDVAGLKPEMLPEIVDSFEQVGCIKEGALSGVDIRSILGDQQSSAYAHELQQNQMKITFGTGCFMLANIGSSPVIHPCLITTILFKHKGKIEYAFEGSIQCGGGTLNWANRTHLFDNYEQLNHYQPATHLELYFFPSFGQIYAPFWKSGVQGGLIGLNLATTQEQIMAAILESILFRVNDNLSLKDYDNITDIFADGGMAKNAQLMQHQSDLINKGLIVRERDTCWGVAKGVLTSLGVEFTGFINQASVSYQPSSEVHAEVIGKYRKWCQSRQKHYSWPETQ